MMRHAVTWVVMANARAAKVMENRGPGRGLVTLDEMFFIAEPAPRSRTDMSEGISDLGSASLDPMRKQRRADARFARVIVTSLTDAFLAKDFDYIVLVAGPHMLGLLHREIAGNLRPVLAGQIPKDLSNQPPHALETQVGEIIPV